MTWYGKAIKEFIKGGLLGLIEGIVFVLLFKRILESANAFQDFLDEVPFGIPILIIVPVIVSAVNFWKIEESEIYTRYYWRERIFKDITVPKIICSLIFSFLFFIATIIVLGIIGYIFDR